MRLQQYFVTASILTVCIFSAGDAYAQNRNIPSSANIDRFEQDMQLRQESDLRASPKKPAIETPALSTEAVPDGADEITFSLETITVEGNTTYSDKELSSLWRKYLGKEISVQRLYEISASITAKYRKDGYVLSRAFIPAQEIDGGNVVIHVVEGYVAEIIYDGANANSMVVQNSFNSIKSSKPVDINALERNLLLLNDLSGVSYRAVLKSVGENSNAGEGAIALHIIEERTAPFDGRIDINNSGSRFIGPHLATARIGYDHSGILAFHRTEFLTSLTVPADELQYFNISHSLPLWRNDLNLIVDASHSNGDPGHTLRFNDIDSRAVSGGARLEWKALRQRGHNLTLSLGARAQNNATDILGQKLSRDHIRSVDLNAAFTWDDMWIADTLSSSSSLNLSLEKGFEGILGGSERGDRDLTRNMGHPDFEVLKVSAYRLQELPYNFSTLAGFSGQLASGPLLSSQEFGYGGSGFGRAYDPSEIVGDQGFSASLELRYNNISLPLNATIQPFVYADFGKVWNLDAGQPEKISGATAGAGTRVALPYNVSASFTVAQPLTKSIDTPQYGNGKNPRYLFTLSKSF